jgi:ribosomal protein S18 acetylase RimI-like enzyme
MLIRLDSDEGFKQRIRKKLEDFNIFMSRDYGHEELNLNATEQGRFVGGLLGGTYWGYLYVDVLIVEESYRGAGIGSSLLSKAEEIARQRGCKHVHLDTHDFQGVQFYIKHGYRIVGELPDLPLGHKRFLMYKSLDNHI